MRTGKITLLYLHKPDDNEYFMTHKNLISLPGSFKLWLERFVFNLLRYIFLINVDVLVEGSKINTVRSRSLMFTAILLLVFAIPMIIVLSAVFNSTDLKLAHWGAVWIKAIFGGVMDLLACPVVAYTALTTRPKNRSSERDSGNNDVELEERGGSYGDDEGRQKMRQRGLQRESALSDWFVEIKTRGCGVAFLFY